MRTLGHEEHGRTLSKSYVWPVPLPDNEALLYDKSSKMVGKQSNSPVLIFLVASIICEVKPLSPTGYDRYTNGVTAFQNRHQW